MSRFRACRSRGQPPEEMALTHRGGRSVTRVWLKGSSSWSWGELGARFPLHCLAMAPPDLSPVLSRPVPRSSRAPMAVARAGFD